MHHYDHTNPDDLDNFDSYQEHDSDNHQVSDDFYTQLHSHNPWNSIDLNNVLGDMNNSADVSHHVLFASSDDSDKPYTYIDDLSHVYLHTRDGSNVQVGRVEDQKFWAEPYDHTDYVGCLGSDWKIYDAQGHIVGYVDKEFNVHKPDGTVVYHTNTALAGAAWMLFGGMGGKP